MSDRTFGRETAFLEEAANWRASREERIRAPFGWLSVIGLYWLPFGSHLCGSESGASVPLPAAPGVPRRALRLLWEQNGSLRVDAEPGVHATWRGSELVSAELQVPDNGMDQVQLPGFVVELLKRGPRMGVRVRHEAAPRRTTFPALRWYAPRLEWVVRGRLEPEPDLKIPIVNVLGDEVLYPSPGHVTFEVAGRRCRLTPVLESADSSTLFFIFRDRTNADTTYGAGRFLFAPHTQDGIALDFNRAVSPPCAFTDAATCPLPPPGNVLEIAVEAGELAPHEVTP